MARLSRDRCHTPEKLFRSLVPLPTVCNLSRSLVRAVVTTIATRAIRPRINLGPTPHLIWNNLIAIGIIIRVGILHTNPVKHHQLVIAIRIRTHRPFHAIPIILLRTTRDIRGAHKRITTVTTALAHRLPDVNYAANTGRNTTRVKHFPDAIIIGISPSTTTSATPNTQFHVVTTRVAIPRPPVECEPPNIISTVSIASILLVVIRS